MTFFVERETFLAPEIDFEELLGRIARKILKTEGCPYEAEVNLLLTGEEEIRRLNREYRGIDRVTDVLSFPMTDYEQPACFPDRERDFTSFHPETGELILGDIVLCAPRALEQSKLYGHGELREFSFLIAHSVLHLIGYDHMEPEEAAVMEEKQNQILDELGIKR